MTRPDPDTVDQIERALGRRPVEFTRAVGGYTPAERWIVRLSDGTSAFVKTTARDHIAAWLRAEHRAYAALAGAPFLPRLLAFDDGDRPMLVLEDLSAARWPPPWRTAEVDGALAALDALHGWDASLPTFADVHQADRDPGLEPGEWALVEADPAPFLGLGLATAQWLRDALPILRAAEREIELAGDAPVHFDVRSDNMCFTGDRALLIDWNHACLGNAALDTGFWLPSLHAEGGPAPESILPDAGPVAAWVSGFFAARAGLPTIPLAPRVRHVQRAQLNTALPWAVRALSLPALPGAG